jgi:hypothetical protein
MKDALKLETALSNTEEGKANAMMDERWARKFTPKEYIAELDVIYKDRENVLIPIVMASRYCTRKFSGVFTKQQLEQQLITLRRSMAKAE